MLDYRHHEEDDLPLSCRELSLDGTRGLNLGSVSSHTSADSALRLTKPMSAPTMKHFPADANEDSDCDSDASGEYEPLRASTSRLVEARSISPPPPVPPPRPRCNSLHSPRPSTSLISAAAAHFSEPPQTSCSLGDLNVAPAMQAPAASRKSLSRFLGMHRPVPPRKFGLLWRRKTERAIRTEQTVEEPTVLLNKSLPNLSGTPAGAARAGARVGALAEPERGSFSLASTPRSVSPSRSRVSPGALHRALKRVHERTLRRGRGPKEQMGDNSQAVMSVSAVTSRWTVGDREATPSPTGSEKYLPAEVSPAVPKQERPVTERRRVSFDSDHFQFPGDDLTESRSEENLTGSAEATSPVYELIAEPPLIVIDCPEDAQENKTDTDRLHDSPDYQNPDKDDDGYMTMDAMQAILRSPPSSLLNVPDTDPSTSCNDPVTPEQESNYLDMAEICRLRRTYTSSQQKTAPPARPPRTVRDDKLVLPRDSAKAEADYVNLSDLHCALQALQRAGGPAITEDE